MYSLYRHFDSGDNLLYVGISNSSLRRTEEHSKTAIWFKHITKITIEHFENRADAIFAEEKAIVKEKPKFNIRCTKKDNFIPTEKELAAEFYHTKLAAYYLGVNKFSLEQRRCRNNGPKFYQFGKGVYYTKRDLDAWKQKVSK